MMIECHRCGHPMEIDAEQFGTTVECPVCHEQINTGEPRQLPPSRPGGRQQPVRTCSLAITSLVAAIVGLPLSLVLCGALGVACSVAAVVCGHIACAQIKKDPEVLGGRGLAIAGLIVGYTVMGIALLGGLAWFGFMMFGMSQSASSMPVPTPQPMPPVMPPGY